MLDPATVWFKVKNPAYMQAEGRGDLFRAPEAGGWVARHDASERNLCCR